MKRATAIAAAILIAAPLAACAEPTGGDSEPETADTNSAACADFQENYADIIVDLVVGAGNRTPEEWRADIAGKAATFDTISLAAEGEVADRIDAVATGFPAEPYTILLSDHRTEYKQFGENTQRVARACEAEGNDMDIPEIRYGF
ncbi:hypothetical protein [Leucobacter manosquensis]|uniref:Lipoprotein n=1 Tax=Leucobacter manosquensis TaxID=2810611 RepID=A0ABS5M140_9MICO|nr:hypothetical protein [Leucobacter manosquensis]MBS3180686.1 hypothetical protein [Leucobacter manosquensis]